MVLFISGSPRKDRATHTMLKYIADKINTEYEIVSFSGKNIRGCIGCELCASDNICKLKDDWNSIAQKMCEADIIVFGAPNYFNNINAITHAFWERTFSFKHQGVYPLQGKKGIIVTVNREESMHSRVYSIIKQFMEFNKIEVVGDICGNGCDPCYTCGYGHNCMVGNVVKEHGVLTEILPSHYPLEISNQEDTVVNIDKIVNLINDITVTSKTNEY